ncbi:OmpA family protein [Allohahella marinimesophila]|uniref:OmpA-like domain-containing protein n=1 Tax=Allohahella marinimesophila TaxID=1054972 RepID=A0ABP7NWB1_9GAMM
MPSARFFSSPSFRLSVLPEKLSLGFLWLVLGVSLVTAGCASQAVLDDAVIETQFPLVIELRDALREADSEELELLAPATHERATQAYEEAYRLAQRADDAAQNRARRGLTALSEAREQAAITADIFEDILRTRRRVIAAGAAEHATDNYRDSEAALIALSRMAEEGRVEQAKAGRQELIDLFEALELEALKTDTVARIEAAMAQAERDELEDYAPHTLKRARDEHTLALATLDADRSNKIKAENHAQRAVFHINRATGIKDIIQMFVTSDFSEEDKVLWYQGQLARLIEPMVHAPAFDEPNKVLIGALRTQVEQLVQDRNRLQLQLDEAERRFNDLVLEQQLVLEDVRAETEAERSAEQARAARFAFVQSLFDIDEAEVYRQDNDVLIRAQGFVFSPGDSEIAAVNFPLLNKVIESIRTFKDARIVVSGHTDSSGDDDSNMLLSQSRASKVAAFLSEVGGFESQRFTSVGYGEQRPIASNESSEGRAENRRVEVLIVNQ